MTYAFEACLFFRNLTVCSAERRVTTRYCIYVLGVQNLFNSVWPHGHLPKRPWEFRQASYISKSLSVPLSVVVDSYDLNENTALRSAATAHWTVKDFREVFLTTLPLVRSRLPSARYFHDGSQNTLFSFHVQFGSNHVRPSTAASKPWRQRDCRLRNILHAPGRSVVFRESQRNPKVRSLFPRGRTLFKIRVLWVYLVRVGYFIYNYIEAKWKAFSAKLSWWWSLVQKKSEIRGCSIRVHIAWDCRLKNSNQLSNWIPSACFRTPVSVHLDNRTSLGRGC